MSKLEAKLDELLAITLETNENLKLLLQTLGQGQVIDHESQHPQVEAPLNVQPEEEVPDTFTSRKITTSIIESYFGDKLFLFFNKNLRDILGSKKKNDDDPIEEDQSTCKEERESFNEVCRLIRDNFYNVDLLLETKTRQDLQTDKNMEKSMRLTSMKIADVLMDAGCICVDSSQIFGIFRKHYFNAVLYRGEKSFYFASENYR
jgi:hypothetical protein